MNDATAELAGAYVKLERGREHLEALLAEAEPFFEAAYRVEIAEDDERRTYILRVDGEQPPRLAAIAGDAVHNLRSALDLAICALVRRNDRRVKRDHCFPIVETERGLSADRLRMSVGDAGDAVVEAVKSLRPYREGNRALWELHRLDVEDKHRLLPTVAMEYRSFGIDVGAIMQQQAPDFTGRLPSFPIALRPAERLFNRLVDGTPLFHEPVTGTRMAPSFNFDLAIAAEGIDAEPVQQLFSRFTDAVEEALKTLARA